MLFYGRGAGERPTASAVISDIVDLARGTSDVKVKRVAPVLKQAKIKNMSSILSRYYLRFFAIDKPGVLAKVAHVLGNHNISLSDVIQQERKIGHAVPLVFLTHETSEKNICQAVKKIHTLSVVKGHSQILRIEE